MKTKLFCFLFILNLIGVAQTTIGLKGHRLEFISSSIDGIREFCGSNAQTRGSKVNLNVNSPLRAGKIYKLDYGEGVNFYRVTFSSIERVRDADENVFNAITIQGPFNPCSLNEDVFTYYRFSLLGDNLESSQLNCDNPLDQIKVNIKENDSLEIGRIYGLNLGNGFKYYFVENSFDSRNQDADETIFSLPDFLGPFSRSLECDLDRDGVYNNEDNCPNTVNPDQSDSDGDGIGDVCDNCINSINGDQADLDNDGIGDTCDTRDNRDSDRDGVQNFEDRCPTVRGIRSNSGCPDIDSDGDGILDSRDNCDNERGPVSNNGCPNLLPANTIIQENDSTVFTNILENSPSTGILKDFKTRTLNLSNLSQITYVLSVRNIGEEKSEKSKIKAYLSLDNKFQSKDDVLINEITVKELSANKSTGVPLALSSIDLSKDDFDGKNQFKSDRNSTFYLLILLNGELVIKQNVKFTASSQKKLITIPSTSSSPYKLSIWNLNGQVVVNKTVENKGDEEILKQNLTRGLYFIKSENETYKYYSN